MASGAASAPRAGGLDLAGVALLAASVAWTWWTGRSGGDALPVAALQVGCAAAYAAARVATRWQRPVVPVAVVAGTCATLVLQSVLPSLAPLSPPLGYANANAALYVLTAVAAAMVAAAFPAGPATAVAVPLGAAFALAAVASASVTAVLILGLAVLAIVARALGSGPGLVTACYLAVQLAVAVTALLGVALLEGRQAALVGSAERLVDERRVLLWRDAAAIAREHPVAGVGAGGFADASPTAQEDADARWAHSGFFQQAAEAGAVGLALLLAAFGWGFARLRAGPGDAFSVLGAVALAALGLHASVDYVLHFAAVPLVTAALVGAASASVRG